MALEPSKDGRLVESHFPSLSQVHRGAYDLVRNAIAVVFGNEGYDDDRTKQEVASLREAFRESRPPPGELGSGLDTDERLGTCLFDRGLTTSARGRQSDLW